MVYTYNQGVQKEKRSKIPTIIAVVMVVLLGLSLLAFQKAFALPPSITLYDNIGTPVPSNVPSIGFEATSTSEVGGLVSLAGSLRSNPKITVLMSSWGCQNGSWNGNNCSTTPGSTFTHDITMNLYNVGDSNSVGTLINSKTSTFAIPFRPSADSTHCSGGDAGKWFDGTSCKNGLGVPLVFDFSGTTLPDNVIISIAYNTTNYGYRPIGQGASCFSTSAGCGYDSLNVGTMTSLSVGSQPAPDDAYLNSTWAGAYCDGGNQGNGSFRLDGGCWGGYQPSFKVEVPSPLVGPATSKDQCKNDGWKTFNNPTYKNQGDCVSKVVSVGRNK